MHKYANIHNCLSICSIWNGNLSSIYYIFDVHQFFIQFLSIVGKNKEEKRRRLLQKIHEQMTSNIFC